MFIGVARSSGNVWSSASADRVEYPQTPRQNFRVPSQSQTPVSFRESPRLPVRLRLGRPRRSAADAAFGDTELTENRCNYRLVWWSMPVCILSTTRRRRSTGAMTCTSGNKARGQRAKLKSCHSELVEESGCATVSDRALVATEGLPVHELPVADPQSKIRKKIPSRTWRELIKKIWNTDPLLCPKCGGEMRLISLIEDQQVFPPGFVAAVRSSSATLTRPTPMPDITTAAAPSPPV